MSLNVPAPLGFVLIGLMLGMRHATDSDHVVAVSTFVSQRRRVTGALRIGLVWGLGHSATVFVVGALIIFGHIAIPIRLGLAMDFAVALVLIALGAGAVRSLVLSLLGRMGLLAAAKHPHPALVHSHPHAHGSLTHSHAHVHFDHGVDAADDAHCDHRFNSAAASSRRRHLMSLGVGLAHGLAGSAAIALLVLSAIPSPGMGDDQSRGFLPGNDPWNGLCHNDDRDAHCMGRVAKGLPAARPSGRKGPAKLRLWCRARVAYRDLRSAFCEWPDRDASIRTTPELTNHN